MGTSIEEIFPTIPKPSEVDLKPLKEKIDNKRDRLESRSKEIGILLGYSGSQ